MGKVLVVLPEDDEPLLTFTAVSRNGAGVDTPIDLTGATMKWVSKLNDDVDDTSGQTINGVGVAPLTNGIFTVQITNAVTINPGKYFYKVVVTKGGRPITVQYGPLLIDST